MLSMLFILVMDLLQRIIDLATERNILNSILLQTTKLRCSLYADDAAIFANPSQSEMKALNEILSLFGRCLGLITNLNKTEKFPIWRDDILLDPLLIEFLGKNQFPLKVLGATTTYAEAKKGGRSTFD